MTTKLNQLMFAPVAAQFICMIVATVAYRCPDDDVGFFRCASNNECVSVSAICDFTHDCSDNSDENMCQTDLLRDNYLVVAEQHGRNLYQIDLDPSATRRNSRGRVVRLLPAIGTTFRIPHAIAFDGDRRVVYWTNMFDGSIRKVSLFGRQRSSDAELGRDSAADVHVYQVPHQDSANVRLYGIAVDVVGNKLYYCDAGDEPRIGEFSMGSVDASADIHRQHRVLFANVTLKPRSLAFYDGQGSTDERSVYWTDDGSHPSINRLYLGPRSTKNVIIAWLNVRKPQGVSIDDRGGVIYWVDGDRIERADLLNGGNRRLIYRQSDGGNFVGIALSQRYIFVTDSSKRSIRRLDRATNSLIDVQPSLTNYLVGIAYYSSAEQQSRRPSTDAHINVDGQRIISSYTTSSRPLPTSSRMTSRRSTTLKSKFSSTTMATPSSNVSQAAAAAAAAMSDVKIIDSGGATYGPTVLAIVCVAVVLIVAMVIVAVAYIRMRTKRIVYVGEPLVEFHTRPVSECPSNAYLDLNSSSRGNRPPTSDLSRDLCLPSSAAEISDEEACGGGLLEGMTTAGARPKMAIPEKVPCDDDIDGYIVPSFTADRDNLECLDYYNSVKRDRDTYLRPSDEQNIYEDI